MDHSPSGWPSTHTSRQWQPRGHTHSDEMHLFSCLHSGERSPCPHQWVQSQVLDLDEHPAEVPCIGTTSPGVGVLTPGRRERLWERATEDRKAGSKLANGPEQRLRTSAEDLGQMDREKLRSWHRGSELASGHPREPQAADGQTQDKTLSTQLYIKCLHHQQGGTSLFLSTGRG